MSVRKFGRAAAWAMSLVVAVLSSLVLLAAWASSPLEATPWRVAGVAVLILAPWGALGAAMMIRERTGMRLP